jgi:DUF4097 and DUF4098 domain-containing protein YvlB
VPFSDPNKRGKLSAHLNSGSITIKGTARKDVLVKYSGEGDDHDHREKSRDGLRRISGGTMDLEVAESNNFVKISSGSWNNSTNLEIEVPSGIDLKVHTYNDGTLRVESIQGEVEMDNYNGDVYAYNISGSAIANSYNGEIKITFDKVTPDTPMSFTTYNGDVDLTFPPTVKFSLKMKTNQGEILSGFDVNLVKSSPVQKKDEKSGVYRVKIDDWVKGDINGGGPEITLKSYNGDLYIRKK